MKNGLIRTIRITVVIFAMAMLLNASTTICGSPQEIPTVGAAKTDPAGSESPMLSRTPS